MAKTNMNPNNIIKSLIPQRLLEFVPTEQRETFANLVIRKVEENVPYLYSEMVQWSAVPDEYHDAVVDEICLAAEQVWSTADISSEYYALHA